METIAGIIGIVFTAFGYLSFFALCLHVALILIGGLGYLVFVVLFYIVHIGIYGAKITKVLWGKRPFGHGTIRTVETKWNSGTNTDV
jgi:hypothetical protein